MNRQIKIIAKRALINLLILLAAFTIQTCVFPLLPVFSAVPNLLLILTFSFGFIYGSKTGMLLGLVSGMLMDLFYTGPFGFYCRTGSMEGTEGFAPRVSICFNFFGINRAEWRDNNPKVCRRYRSGSWRRWWRAAGSLRSRFSASINAGKARKPLFRW